MKEKDFSFIAFRATREEKEALETIMKDRKRHSKSDALRNLIVTEYEKILQRNTPIGVSH